MKLNKSIGFLIIILFTGSSLALANILSNPVCPSIDEIARGDFKQWLLLNINNDEPASAEEIKEFKKTASNFTGAQWSSDYMHGYGRCNYGWDMEVYLASNNIPLPIRPTHEPWRWNGIVATCLGSIKNCVF